jgi:hypothetical protein
MFGTFRQVLCSGRVLGRFEKEAANIACPYLYCLHTYIYVAILGIMCVELNWC